METAGRPRAGNHTVHYVRATETGDGSRDHGYGTSIIRVGRQRFGYVFRGYRVHTHGNRDGFHYVRTQYACASADDEELKLKR